MNIVVTGANGQLGLKIKDCSEFYPDFNFLYLDIEDLDITAKSLVDNFFATHKTDVLINCAAYTAVEKAEEEPDKAELLNSKAPGYLAMACKKYGVKFIHISTDYVFDGESETPYNEFSQTNPQSVYGRTKLNGEYEVMKHNPDSLIIRTSWLYSEYGNNFVKTILRLAKEKEFLKVVNDQFGTPTYAGDLAETILEILKKSRISGIMHSGFYHFSDLGKCSWYDFAVKILKISGINTPVMPVTGNEFPSKVKRPSYSVLDKSKIVKDFNISIPQWEISLKKMLEKYLS